MQLAFLQPHDRTTIPAGSPGEATGAVTPEEAAAALHTVLALFDRWELTRAEQCVLLGGVSDRTLSRWRQKTVVPGSITTDLVFRLGCLLGIHKALRYMFSDVQRAYAWVRRPNAAFGNSSALDVMLSGGLLGQARVRSYLDAERGAW